MIDDIIAAIGVLLLCAGVTVRFGWEFAAIIVGLILIYMGYAGAVNDTEETISKGTDDTS